MTFSHTSACSPALVRSSPCSDRLAVLRRSLWQVTQYRSRTARGFSLEAGDGAEPGARAAAAPTHRTTDRPIAQPRTRTQTNRAGSSGIHACEEYRAKLVRKPDQKDDVPTGPRPRAPRACGAEPTEEPTR